MEDKYGCIYPELGDEGKVQEFFSQFPEEIADEDSPEADEILALQICGRPSCLLNVRVLLCNMTRPSDPEHIEDMDLAVPPECEWRKLSGRGC